MSSPSNELTLVIDIGGTTTRGARFEGGNIRKVVQCPTPTMQMAPDISVEVLQAQLVELIADLIASASHDASDSLEDAPKQIAIAFSGRVSDDGRSITSAPDVWGVMEDPYPLAERIEERLDSPANVLIASDVVALATQYGRRASHLAQRFALLVVRTDLKYAICETLTPERRAEPTLLGHLTMANNASTYECMCGGVNHFTAHASGTGAVNVLICSALQNPKAFRSSHLFRLAAQRCAQIKFDQRLALQRRHAVRRNARELIDDDVWRNMHDRHAEITPAEMQRWVFPTVLDAGMFIDAVNAADDYALELLDIIAAPVARHLREEILDHVDVVALTGGFARALGDAYRIRIAPAENPEIVQWAEDDDLDDLRATRSLLFPTESEAVNVIDLRDGLLSAG